MKATSILGFLSLTPLSNAFEFERQNLITTATYTQQICSTFLGTASLAKVPTTTMVVTISLQPLAYLTVTPTNTITPSPSTVTVTTTKTFTITNPIITDTFTETETSTETSSTTSISILNSTFTTNFTTVIAASTSIVPTRAGFVYPQPTVAKTGVIRVRENVLKKNVLPLAISRSHKQPAARFPSQVVCSKAIQVIRPFTISVRPWQTTAITISAVTRTITSTKTTTSTKTFANALTTLTQFATTTSTTTISVNSTSITTTSITVTQQPPAETSYAACDTQNQVSRDSSNNRIALFAVTGPLNPVSNTNTAYDCCVLCQKTPNCAGSNFIAVLSPQGASCQLNLYNSCPSDQDLVAETYYSKDLGADIIVSNGLCGQYQFVDGIGNPLNFRGTNST